MDKRILELALEALHKHMAAVDAEIQSIRDRMKGGAAKKTVTPVAPIQAGRTVEQRKAQSLKMKKIWAEKRAQAAKAQATKKPTPAKQKSGPQSSAARSAVSKRMKAYWKKRKSEEAKAGKKSA
jgi:hypothetical protein